MTAAPGIVVDGGGVRDYGGAGSMFPSTTSRVDDGLMAATRRFRVRNSAGPRWRTPKLDARDSEQKTDGGERRPMCGGWDRAAGEAGERTRGSGGKFTRGEESRNRFCPHFILFNSRENINYNSCRAAIYVSGASNSPDKKRVILETLDRLTRS